MGPDMRRFLTIPCDGATLAATLDEGVSSTGVLIVTGGTEIRSGGHGGFSQLAAALAARGHPVLRFDRRGVGDSDGDDPGFRGSRPDITAALAALRTETGVARVIGLGLCDGATALALHHGGLGLDGLILTNPWVIEPKADLPPPAAIRARYVERLASLDGWKRLLSGGVDLRKLLKGVTSLAQRSAPAPLATRASAALIASRIRFELILATGDTTALAFTDAWRGPNFAPLRGHTHVTEVATRSHSFARRDEPERLAQLCVDAIGRLTTN